MLRSNVRPIAWIVATLGATSLLACTLARVPSDALYACDDAGRCPDGFQCSAGTCVPTSDACEPTTCAAQGANCGALLDGCGGLLQCGECTAPETCGGAGAANVCAAAECTAETPSQLCARFNRACGELSAKDNCGASRTVVCGTCEAPETCGGGGVPFHCGVCTPLTDEALCVREGATCEVIDTTDNCGNPRSVACGCASGICQADGGCCVPKSDAALCAMYGRTCGPLMVSECGLERQIESCGTCEDPSQCTDTGSCGVCVPESEPATCLRYGRACGPLEANDNCGTPMSLDCGDCSLQDCSSGVGCTCSPNLSACIGNAGCCSGTCGPAALCCVLDGQPCLDDPDCCTGSCALGACAPFAE